jgi:hypothetical protein
MQNGTAFRINYASGPVVGYLGQDTVNMAGIDVANVMFAEITDASGLGLAYDIGGNCLDGHVDAGLLTSTSTCLQRLTAFWAWVFRTSPLMT